MPKMKDSGIEWIGEIPESWEVRKGKYMFHQKNDKGNSESLTLLSPTQNYGVIPQDLYEQLSGFSAVKLNEKTNFKSLKTVHKGAFVISLRSFQGGFEYSEYEGVVSPAYQVFYPTIQICDGYYKYLFKTQVFIDKMNSYTMSLRDGKNIAFADFGHTYIPLPSPDIQKSISDFLDKKCSEIDSLQKDIEKEIEILERYKKSIITEAVTKGLNPDIEMKDSGIEWIGMIPKHWNTTRIKFHADIKGRIGFRGYTEKDLVDEGEGAITLSPSNFNSMMMNYNKCSYISWFKYYESPEIIINNGDILFVKTGSSFGKNCLVSGLPMEATINPQLVVFKNITINNNFFAYMLQSTGIRIQSDLAVVGGTIPTMSQNRISNFSFALPSIDEQNKIVEYLNVVCTTIDDSIADKKEQLITLAEYKKSLIYEYVTGKKDVSTESYEEDNFDLNPILLGAIINKLGKYQTGRIQLQKILYLTCIHLGLNTNAQYYRYNHGPYDIKLNEYIDALTNNRWFDEKKGKSVLLIPGEKNVDFLNKHKGQIESYNDKIVDLLNLLYRMNSLKRSRLERITTLYAVWNDFLLEGVNPSDDEIIKEVITNWTDNKNNFQYSTWQDSLNKMKKHGLIPKGVGLHTISKSQKEALDDYE